MNRQILFAGLVLVLVAAVLGAGCTSSRPAGTQAAPLQPAATIVTSGSVSPSGPVATFAPVRAETTATDYGAVLAAVRSDSPVWAEAYRIFRNMKSTEYVHTTYVDEEKGIYRFDCLGFVDYVLQQGAPAAFKAAGKGYERPEMVVYGDYFAKLGTEPNAEGWSRIFHPVDLKPGDICLWQKKTSDSVGHMWIIAGTPQVNPERKDEVMVRILDSDGVHGDDSRAEKSYKYGLGTGVLGMMIDTAGNPVGLYWIGGNLTSPALPDPTIECARYRA